MKNSRFWETAAGDWVRSPLRARSRSAVRPGLSHNSGHAGHASLAPRSPPVRGSKSELDPVFLKGTPLPAEKKVKYRAMHALVPDNPESDLAIKLWEGEFREDPEANEWVGTRGAGFF